MGLEKDLLQLIADGTHGSFSSATGTTNVTNTSDAVTSKIEQTLLSAVTSTGASSAVNTSNFKNKTFHIVASSITSGGTMKIQSSLDNSNWADIDTTTVLANGTTEVSFGDIKHTYVRANLTARTDGTYTVTMIAGN